MQPRSELLNTIFWKRTQFLRVLVVFALLAGVFGSGCRRADGDSTISDGLPEPAGHPVTGAVLQVRKERGAVLFKIETSGSVARECLVSPGDLQRAVVGRRYQARMVEGGGSPRLEGLWPAELREDATIIRAAAELREETQSLGKDAYRLVGDLSPAFALFDQNGDIVQARNLRGRWIVLNFIFTRCAVPSMCPASTAKMVRLQRATKDAKMDGVQFVSITLDPEYDTPAVLADYAAGRGIDTSNFSLLTGPSSAIADLLRQFGVLVAPSDNILKHTASTLLISPEGRIVYREDGSQWLPDGFFARLRSGLTEQPFKPAPEESK